MPNLNDCPDVSNAAQTAGYKNPPARTRWQKGKSGNPSGKKKGQTSKSIKDIVMKAASNTITVKGSDGQMKTLNQAEALMMLIFSRAAHGDVGALKIVINWAKEYLATHPDETETKQTQQGGFSSVKLTQEWIDIWREAGCLPPDCPDKLEDIDEKTLNQAARLAKKLGV
jgi:hypothetical protein